MNGRRLPLSIVVVAYDMERELPRTLGSLSVPYQRDIEQQDYEIIVVDNGSPAPVEGWLAAAPSTIVHRIDAACPSPAQAANVGIGRARGDLVGLVIDGARLASPRLLSMARTAAGIADRAVVTAPAWRLGTGTGPEDPAAEDALLAGSGWEDDGYNLFSIATPAPSSGRGLFGAMGESSSLFLTRDLWDELGGLDERFSLPGGGLVNHDLYRRACSLPAIQLVVMLGEGTFHQSHGGAATSGRLTRDEMWADYEAIRGEPHVPPANRPMFIGHLPPQYLPYVAESVERATRVHR
jgi:glycosyltransferase involved in cell wall biosynthesis